MAAPGYIPGPLVIPFTFQVRLLWFLPNGRIATNVLHAIVPDGLDNSQALANAVMTNIVGATNTPAYFGMLASTVALQAIDIRDLRTPNRALLQSENAAHAGTGTGNPLPEEVSLVVTLRSELAGRAHRGRVYLTGFDDSVLDGDGHATGFTTGAAQAWMNDVYAQLGVSALVMGIGHRGHAAYTNAKGQPVAAEAPGTDPIVSIIVKDNIFDSQRRRK